MCLFQIQLFLLKKVLFLGNDADVASVRQIFSNYINSEDKNEPKTKRRAPLSDTSVEQNESPRQVFMFFTFTLNVCIQHNSVGGGYIL